MMIYMLIGRYGYGWIMTMIMDLLLSLYIGVY